MRSLFAALRTLVLPAGATGGKRIILDGINGLVLVYDSRGDLIAYMAPDYGTETTGKPYRQGVGTIPRYDTLSGILRTAVSLDAAGYVIFSYNANSPAVPFVADGAISGFNPDTPARDAEGAYLLFTAPTTNAASDPLKLELRSRSKDGTQGFRLRLFADVFASAANANATAFETAGWHSRITRTGSSDAVEVWNTQGLAANWTQNPENVQYKLHPDGTVRLRGGATYTPGVPPGGTTVFTLPAGYRPTANRLFIVPHWGGAFWSRIQIAANGVAQIFDAPNNMPTFDEISFSVLA